MSIFSDKNIYGVSWNIYDKNDIFIKRFEKTYITKIDKQKINEIKKEYFKLNNNELKYAKFKIYTCCTSTYNINFNNEYTTFMCWYPASKKDITNLFYYLF